MNKTKFSIFVLVIFSLSGIFTLNAQRRSTSNSASKVNTEKGSITGVVRYKFNDYQGYKVDLGATVIAVPISELDSILSYSEIMEYEKLAEKQTKHNLVRREFIEEGLNGGLANQVAPFYESDEKKLNSLDPKILEAFALSKSKKSNMALVDASGTFTMEIPYGEYYIIFKSKNRERGTMSELTGRIHFEKINLSSPTEIIECDFDY